MERNIGCWFEIPVNDMDRAVDFYEAVFKCNIELHHLGNEIMGWFPYAKDRNAPNAGGSLIYGPKHYVPSENGTLIYLTSFSNDVSVELSRVEAAGGEVLATKKLISEEIGYMGLFKDTEGNRIGLYSTA